MPTNASGEGTGTTAVTIIPFPSQQAQEQAQFQRQVLSMLRRLPKRHGVAWLKMGKRLVHGMPMELASELFHIECDIADHDANIGIWN